MKNPSSDDSRHTRRLVEQEADRNTQALADGTEGYAKHEGADVLLKDLTGTTGSLKETSWEPSAPPAQRLRV